MKKAKRNIIATSLVSIALSSAIISGATYALFTSESKTNIAVTSGTVDVVATIDEESLKTYSGVDLTGNVETDVIEETAVNGIFTNGGTAKLNDNGDLDLVNVTPGDKVTLNINIKNNSDVAAKYQTIISSFDDSDLFEVLKFTINGNAYDGSSVKSSWSKLEAEEDIIDSEATVPVEVLFPTDVNNDYQEKSCTVSFIVNALQANAYIAEDEEDRNKRLGKTPVFDDENGTVTYGLYPQTHVNDGDTIAALNALTTADSNGWYLYNDE